MSRIWEKNTKSAPRNPENKSTVYVEIRNLFAILAKPEYRAEALGEERKEELAPAEVYRNYYYVAEDGDTAEPALMNTRWNWWLVKRTQRTAGWHANIITQVPEYRFLIGAFQQGEPGVGWQRVQNSIPGGGRVGKVEEKDNCSREENHEGKDDAENDSDTDSDIDIAPPPRKKRKDDSHKPENTRGDNDEEVDSDTDFEIDWLPQKTQKQKWNKREPSNQC